MRYKLIIDTDLNKYYPSFNLSQTISNEFNVNKFDHCYLFIDDLGLFKKYYTLYNYDRITFLYNKNVMLNTKNIDVEVINYEMDNIDFKKKIIKSNFIYNYLFEK